MKKEGQDIFDEFLHTIRYIDGHIVKWWSISEDTIIVQDDEGWYHKYDSILKADTVSSKLANLLTTNVNTKNAWIKKFSANLYRSILKSGYNQDMLAWDSKIGSGSISRYINGESVPSIYILLKLSNTMNCTVQDVMDMLCINSKFVSLVPEYKFIEDEEEWRFEFSIRLSRLFRKRKLTQHIVSEELDISPESVSKYIKGERIPSAYVIHCLIKELNLDSKEIMELLGF